MQGAWRDELVIVGGTARQQFHDTRGFGLPLSGSEVALSPVEAAYLLARGDLNGIDGEGISEFFSTASRADLFFARHFLAYTDLRNRGFYLAPHREGWVATPRNDADYVVYERGSDRQEGSVAFHVGVVAEQENVPASALGSIVLAVVDDEGEVTYFETNQPVIEGGSTRAPITADGELFVDRVVVWDPPEDLYHRGFYGRPIMANTGVDAIQLSLVEAVYLVREGWLRITTPGEDGVAAVLARGRKIEGARFDRRVHVYSALRDQGIIPKSGLKFGADFRTYPNVTSVDDLGHSTDLVHVIPIRHEFVARELALMVRLAHGVRKRTLFAVTDGTEVLTWFAVSRLTP